MDKLPVAQIRLLESLRHILLLLSIAVGKSLLGRLNLFELRIVASFIRMLLQRKAVLRGTDLALRRTLRDLQGLVVVRTVVSLPRIIAGRARRTTRDLLLRLPHKPKKVPLCLTRVLVFFCLGRHPIVAVLIFTAHMLLTHATFFPIVPRILRTGRCLGTHSSLIPSRLTVIIIHPSTRGGEKLQGGRAP